MSKRKTISRTRGKEAKRGAQTLAANAKKKQTTNVLRGVFIGLLATVVTFASVAVLSRNVFAEVGVDGRMMPANIGVEAQLRSDEPQIIDLINVEGDDTVLSMLGIYYLDGRRASVDINFPIWMNNGTTLKFLSEDIKLITTDLYTEQTFAGLYISEGTTYTEDLIQADWEEFIFILLPNGLYLNVQDMVVKTPIGRFTVPSNSILMMTQDYFRYYVMDGATMAPESINMSNDMTIIFGENEYEYLSLLKKLGLFHEVDDPTKQDSENTDDISNNPGDVSDVVSGSTSDTDSESDNSSTPEKGESENESEKESKTGESHGGKEESQKSGSSGEVESEDSDESGVSEIESESESESESIPGGESSIPEREPESDEEGSGEGESESGTSTSGESESDHKSHDKESESDGKHESGEPSGESGELESEESESESESQGVGESDDSQGEESESESESESELSGESEEDESEGSKDNESEGSFVDDSTGELPDEDEDQESHTRTGSDDPGVEGGGGKTLPYKVPTVSIAEFDPWCYAINLHLTVKDRSKAILGGVKITVWSRLENGAYSGITTEDGIRIFTAKAGKAAVFRRTYNSTGDATLSIVPPNTTLYIQYSYRYYYETKTVENGETVTTRTRLTYSSDFYEITTQPATSENFHDINMNMDVAFAYSDTTFSFKNLLLSNSTDYDSSVGTFAEFKKDSLPYINRIELKLTKTYDKGVRVLSGQTVTVKLSASVLTQAKLGATLYKATAGILEPDCVYSFKVSATDKYSNPIPLVVNSINSTEYRGDIYTSKSAPVAKITVDENVTDKLTLRIKISDPYDALLKDESNPSKNQDVYLIGVEVGNASQVVIMTGEWKENRTGKVTCDTQGRVMLENPQDGKEYVLMIDSLAFAQSYYFYVYGGYYLQPTHPATESLEVKASEALGDAKCYTASLSSGLVAFRVDFSKLTDTSVNISYQMLSKTTTDILPIVDEFRFKVTNHKTGQDVFSFNFSLDEFGDKEKSYSYLQYDEEEHGLILQEGDARTARVLLLGEKEEFLDVTPWDAFLISMTHDEVSDEDIYSIPSYIKVIMPSNLTTSTNYDVTIDSVVLKGGREYTIPTTLSNTAFMTRKIAPKIYYDTLFVAGSVAEFINYQIYDPDGTILNDGLVYAYLYYGDTLLTYNTINATKDRSAGIANLRFDDLIVGGEYTIKLVAVGYNDADGWTEYHPNYTSETDPNWVTSVTGGSNLYADLNLKYFDYSSSFEDASDFLYFTGEQIDTFFDETAAGTRTGNMRWYNDSTFYYTERFDVNADITFIELVEFDPDVIRYGGVRMYFYNEKGNRIVDFTAPLSVTTGYNNVIWEVPVGTVQVMIGFGSDRDSLKNGFYLRKYSTPRKDIMHNSETEKYIVKGKYIDGNGNLANTNANYRSLYMYPVNPGDVYTVINDCGALYYYSEDGVKLYSLYSPGSCRSFVIPEDVYYLSTYWGSYTEYYALYRVSEARVSEGYTLTFDVDAYDKLGYLAEAGATLTLEVYRALTENDPEFPDSFNEKESESESESVIESQGEAEESEAEDSTTELNLEDYLQGERCYRLKLQLTDDGEKWVYLDNNKTITFNNLTANNSYMFVLSCEYKGTKVILDTETMRTDGRYIIVDSQYDLFLITRCNFDNFYVVKDLTITKSVQVNPYGLVDFNGHKVTSTTGTYSYGLFMYNYGTIRNLVHTFQETKDEEDNITTTPVPVCYQNFGTIENIIVRTPGLVYIKTSTYDELLCFYNYYGGIIRNVEVELNGDVYMTGNCAVVVRENCGDIENMYLYGAEDAGVIMDGQYGSVFVYYNDRTFNSMKHCYTNVNIWVYNSDTGACDQASIVYSNYIGSNLDGWYHVGDFYNWTGKKVKLSPTTRQHMIYDITAGADVKNMYLISRFTYSNLQSVLYTRDYSALYDVNFQQSVLGDGYDVANCVKMHFYPRLKFPSTMQKEQAYVSLPSLSLTDVSLASDGWATGNAKNIQADSGNIVLSFHNPSSATITEVEIDGLVVTQIVNQYPKNDGSDLYDLILSVSVDLSKPKYLSTYTVKKFLVSNGAYTKTYEPNYKTTGFSFWKLVSSADDWAEINSHMDWNYRLTTSIDFSKTNLSQAAIMINGSKVKTEATSTFTGSIDGNGYTLSNIKILNNRYPYVFYYVNSKTSTIKNLYIDGLEITASNISMNFCGFFRQVNQCMFENVHFSNCSVSGTGYIGVMCAYMSYGSVTECSVVNSTTKDNRGNYTVYAGAMFGQNSRADMYRCFVRDVLVDIQYSKSSQGVGSMCGYTEITNCIDCYATGKVKSCCDYTGGLIGYCSYPMYRCFIDVDVITTGSYAGGMAGRGDTTNYVESILVCGDVVADGTNVNRLIGNKTNNNRVFFAYEKQAVTGFVSTQYGDAATMLSKDALTSVNTWKDLMVFGDSWNYSGLSSGFYPKLVSKNGGYVPNQVDIVMPGQGGEPVLTFTTSNYDPNQDLYSVALLLEHPSKTYSQIVNLIKNGDIIIEIEGVDLSEAAINAGISNISYGFGVTDKSTQILLEVFKPEEGFTMRKDNYKIKVTANYDNHEYELQASFSFPNIMYWQISDITEWNNKMNLHGMNTENFKITGLINFGGDTIYRNLAIGRLEGEGPNAGFTGLNYTADASGAPWIETIFREMSGLTFTDFTIDFGPTTEGRGLTGLIMLCPGVKDCNFNGLTLTFSKTTTNYIGFFSQVRGVIDSVTLSDSSLKVKDNAARIYNYGGILAGYCVDGVLNSTFTDLRIEGGYSQAGCAVGRVYESAKYTSAFNTFTRCVCDSYYHSAACFGYVYKMSDTVITDCSCVCAYYAGNITGWCRTASNVDFYNCSVECKSGYNGYGSCVSLMGNESHSSTYTDIVMVNCSVVGKNCNAGLITGYTYSGAGTFKDCVAIGCTVTSTSGSYADSCNAGAFVSNARVSNTYTSCVVRDTTISAMNHAGGFVGYSISNQRMTFTKCQISEDVTISSVNGTAGGLVGPSYLFTISDCIVGATIKTGSSMGCGGLVGKYTPMEEVTSFSITNSIFNGSLSAPDYASAVIGRFESVDVQSDNDKIHNVLVMGSITTTGVKATPWGTSISESGSCGDMGVLVYEDFMINGQSVKGIYDSYDAVSLETYIMPQSGEFLKASDFADKTKMVGYGITETNWIYDHYVEGNIYMPYPRGTVDTTIVAPYADKKIVYIPDEEGVNKRVYVPATEETVTAGIVLPSATAKTPTVLVYPSAIDAINIEYLPNAVVQVNGVDVTLNEQGVKTIAYTYTEPININNRVYQVSELARTVMTADTYWYYIAEDGIHYGNNKDSSACVKPADGTTIAADAVPVHMWGGYVLYSDATYYTLSAGLATFDGAIIGTSRDTHALYAYFTTIGNDTHARVDVYARFTMFGDTRVDKQSFLLTEYNKDGDPIDRYYSPEGSNVPDGVYLIRYKGPERDHRFLIILEDDGTLHSYLDTGVLGAMEITGISHISNSFFYGDRVLLARYNDGNVIGIDILTGETLIDTRTGTQSIGDIIRHGWDVIFNNPGPNFVYTVDQLPADEREEVEEIIANSKESEIEESATESGSGSGHGGSSSGEVVDPGTQGGQTDPGDTPEEKKEKNIYYSQKKGIYTDDEVLFTPEQITRNGNDFVVDGKVVYTVNTSSMESEQESGGSTAGGTSGSSVADGTAQGHGDGKKDEAEEAINLRKVNTYTLEEIFGDSVMMLNEETNSFEEVSVKDLNEKGERKADRTSDKKGDNDKKKEKKTLSEVIEEIQISWNVMSAPQKTGYIFIVVMAVAVMAVLIVVTSHFIKKKKVVKK